MRRGGRPDERLFIFLFSGRAATMLAAMVCRLSFVTSGSGRWCNSVTPVAALQRRCGNARRGCRALRSKTAAYSAIRLAVRRNGTARSRKLTVLPMRILRLRLETHLHLTLQRSCENSVSRPKRLKFVARVESLFE